ncbi:MAG: energy transducer TonB [Balneolaceae bacterium]
MRQITILFFCIFLSLGLFGQPPTPTFFSETSEEEKATFRKIDSALAAYEQADWQKVVELYQDVKNSNFSGHKLLIAVSTSYAELYEESKIDSFKTTSEEVYNRGLTWYGERIMKEGYEEDIYTIVENPPKPISGLEKDKKTLYLNLNYPKSALNTRIEGRVFVQFIVNKDGQVSGTNVVKGIDSACDKAAAQLINDSKWEPGTQRGKAVNVKRIEMIEFNIRKYQKQLKKYGQ